MRVNAVCAVCSLGIVTRGHRPQSQNNKLMDELFAILAFCEGHFVTELDHHPSFEVIFKVIRAHGHPSEPIQARDRRRPTIHPVSRGA